MLKRSNFTRNCFKSTPNHMREATIALDVSVQTQILELLKELGEKNNMSVLFISHDLAPVSSFCQRTYVMFEGEIVAQGDTMQIISNLTNDCAKAHIFCL